MFQPNPNLRREAGNPLPKTGSEDKVRNYGEGGRQDTPSLPESTGEADKAEVSARISQTSNGGDSGHPPPELTTLETKEQEKEVILLPREITTQEEKPQDLLDVKLLDVEDMIEKVIQAVEEAPEYFTEMAQPEPEPEHIGGHTPGQDENQDPQASTIWNDEPTVRFAEEHPTDIAAEGVAKKSPGKAKVAKPALKHKEPAKPGKKSPVNDKIGFFGTKKTAQSKVEKPTKQRALEAALAKYRGNDSSDFLAKLSFLDNIDRKITWGKAKAYPGSVTVSELNDDGTGTSRVNRLATKIRKRKKPPPPQPKPKFEGMSLLRSILGISSPSPNTKRRGAISNVKEARRKTSGRRQQGHQSPSQTAGQQSSCGKQASNESKGKASPGRTTPAAETKDAKKDDASAESEKSTTRTDSDSSEDTNT